MSNDFKPLQGMTDISNPDIFQWQKIEQIAHSVLTNFGYSELRTPILEKSDVFIHSLGNASDIVLKEMYNLEDRGGRSLVLRPEGTAGAIRFLASLGEEAYNNKIYYMGPMFRCERPQAGRKRQFHQIGVESINNPNPYIDAECIALQYEMLKKWGIENATIKINTLGSTDDQKNIREGLYSSLKKEIHNFPEDYQKRIKENVLRVLDWNNEEFKQIIDNLPSILTFMSDDSRQYLESVIKTLNDLDIPVEHDSRLVRGLDYYNHTVWEIIHTSLGSQNSIAGGGRYTIQIGRKEMNGVGFAMGIERVISVLQNSKKIQINQEKKGFYLISLGEKSVVENMKLAKKIRSNGIRCSMELENKSMKAQLRKADRFGATHVIIRGDDEIKNDILIFKDLEDGVQEEYKFSDWIEKILGV